MGDASHIWTERRESNILLPVDASELGQALCKKLLDAGHDIVVFDVERAEHLPSGVDFVPGDVRNTAAVRAAAAGCDAGIHLAVLAGESSAEDIMSVNVAGVYAFLSAAESAQFFMSIVASSAPVHLQPGPLDDGLLLRTSEGRDHVYDLTKTIQEVIARDFHVHGLPVLCLRFGHMVCGEKETDLAGNTPLTELDYCRGGWVALEDVVAACASALDATPDPDKFEILNIVGARTGRDRFQVANVEERLGLELRFDFAHYE